MEKERKEEGTEEKWGKGMKKYKRKRWKSKRDIKNKRRNGRGK